MDGRGLLAGRAAGRACRSAAIRLRPSGRPLQALHTERFDGLPPFTSGLVGFLGWESVRHWEKLVSPPEDDLRLPELALNLVADMAVHDNAEGTVLLIANAINFDNSCRARRRGLA